MPDTRRLVAKMDEAIKGLKPMRKQGHHEGTKLAEALRERFETGRPFSIQMGGQEYPVKCDNVRVSRTNVDLGIKEADGFIPLTRVAPCEIGKTQKGEPVMGYGVIEDDDSVTPIVVL